MESKEIETINVGFPDQYGRLMGKKVESRFFQESVLEKGTTACVAMLGGCDIDYHINREMADWQSGYGDMHLQVDTKAIRRHWLPG